MSFQRARVKKDVVCVSSMNEFIFNKWFRGSPEKLSDVKDKVSTSSQYHLFATKSCFFSSIKFLQIDVMHC